MDASGFARRKPVPPTFEFPVLTMSANAPPRSSKFSRLLSVSAFLFGPGASKRPRDDLA